MSVASSTKKAVLGLVASALCWLGAQALGSVANDERATWPAAEDYVWFLPPPKVAPIMFAGYRQMAADVTWARTLVYYGSSFVGDADYRYLEQYIDNVIALDPKFKRVYQWASYAVTFKAEKATNDEFKSAVKYLERGIKQFPDGYELYWIAGQRYFFDLYSKDKEERRRYRERGAELIEKAMRKEDAPKDLAKSAAAFRMKLGQKERALHALREIILTTENEKAQKVLIERYNLLAKKAFPKEETDAKKRFLEGWKRGFPFTNPSMYVLLGDRPSPYIDFDRLAFDRDLFGTDVELTDQEEGDGESLPPEKLSAPGGVPTPPPAPPKAQHLP